MKKRENTTKKKKSKKKCTKKTKIVMPRFELTPLNNVLKQNVKVTKPASLQHIIRHMSIADNLCLLQ